MIEFTIDTNVLAKADMEGDAARVPCFVFLAEFQANPALGLVLDNEKLIEGEYRRVMKPSRFGHRWLTFMLLRQTHRVRPYDRVRIPRGAGVKLRDRGHIHKRDADYFVRTALASNSKRIVTHDGDFWRRCRLILWQELVVKVDRSQDVHTELCGGNLQDCEMRFAALDSPMGVWGPAPAAARPAQLNPPVR